MAESIGTSDALASIAVELKYDTARLTSDLPKIREQTESAIKAMPIRVPILCEASQVRTALENAVRAAVVGLSVKIPIIFEHSGGIASGGSMPLLPGGTGSRFVPSTVINSPFAASNAYFANL